MKMKGVSDLIPNIDLKMDDSGDARRRGNGSLALHVLDALVHYSRWFLAQIKEKGMAIVGTYKTSISCTNMSSKCIK
jgi:hypothetical protein